jgi:hypothetical protein
MGDLHVRPTCKLPRKLLTGTVLASILLRSYSYEVFFFLIVHVPVTLSKLWCAFAGNGSDFEKCCLYSFRTLLASTCPNHYGQKRGNKIFLFCRASGSRQVACRWVDFALAFYR